MPTHSLGRVLGVLLLGAVCAGAADAQVVLRERVVLGPETAAPPEATLSACDGEPVATWRVQPSPSATTGGALLEGSAELWTSCGGTRTVPLSTLWTLTHANPATQRYIYAATDAVLEMPLRPLEETRLTLRLPGAPAALQQVVGQTSVGVNLPCSGGLLNGTCTDRGVPLDAVSLSLTGVVDGRATGHRAWPDSVACGSRRPVPLVLTQNDGREGYVGPALMLRYRHIDRRGVMRYRDSVVTGVSLPYAEARAGAVSYEARPCETMTERSSASVWVEGLPQGGALTWSAPVVPRPVAPPSTSPARFVGPPPRPTTA